MLVSCKMLRGQYFVPATAIFHKNGTYTLDKQSLQHAQCVANFMPRSLQTIDQYSYGAVFVFVLFCLFVIVVVVFCYSVQSVSFLYFKSLAMKFLRLHFTGEPFKRSLLLASSSIFVFLFRMCFENLLGRSYE